jgi:hypothetical protein
MAVMNSNLLAALVSGDPRGGKVLRHFTERINQNVEIYSSLLAKCEAANNALTRLIVRGALLSYRTGR